MDRKWTRHDGFTFSLDLTAASVVLACAVFALKLQNRNRLGWSSHVVTSKLVSYQKNYRKAPWQKTMAALFPLFLRKTGWNYSSILIFWDALTWAYYIAMAIHQHGLQLCKQSASRLHSCVLRLYTSQAKQKVKIWEISIMILNLPKNLTFTYLHLKCF